MGARRLRRTGATLFLVVALATLVALATGAVRLVTTHGVSMLPRFHTGDLAVIVRAPTYHVGEIVGYYSPLLHIVVLHRIVAEHAGRFTFKGDHNNFLDPVRLPASSIRGRLLLHVPHGGQVLALVRSPAGLGFVAFGFVALGVSWTSRRVRMRNRKARSFRRAGAAPPRRAGVARRGRPLLPTGPRHAAARDTTAVPRWPIAIPAACMLVAAAFAFAAWTHPTTRAGMRTVAYRQGVTFTYTARVPKGVAYPSGLVQTGQPVFLRLTDGILVTARYQLRPGATPAAAATTAARLSGTIGATVDLQGPEGWRGQVTSVGPTRFSGSTASVTIGVGVARVDAVAHSFAQETGVALGSGNIVVTPTVHVRGAVAGAAVADSFSPSLSFQMSGSELYLLSSTPDAASGGSQLSPSTTGSADAVVGVPATVPVLGLALGVDAARALAVAALVLSLVAGLVVVARLEGRRRMDEPARIRAAHGHDLVVVSSSPATDAPLVVDVETFGGLVRLADRFDCVILELTHEAGHTYYVECGATVYRYGSEPGAGPVTDDPGPPSDLTYHVTALRTVS